ncbi:LamG-like jellyroll fold domain-containing protein [Microtetraspora niveoalba]|uniref:LamG-like jellyroll fold domain-containing protein n=1 Tax=Microtetraspora niveoalba TaxID=46175 RepID=UPI000836908E|nr:LamG-like jellyroll fold domain-containing protein [Microtetraspora niveoalba]
MIDMPQIAVEIAFTRDPDDGTPLWQDVTDDVDWDQKIRISRRRSHELDEVAPGTLALTLFNEDGRYTADNAAGANYPNVKLNRMIRVRARWPGGPNRLASGQATASDASLFSGSQGSVTIDTNTFPPGQTSSIRWAASTLSNGTILRVGAKSTSSPTDQAFHVKPGDIWSFQCQARRDTVAATMALRVRWYDKAARQLGDTTGPAVTLTTAWQPIVYSPTVPAGAAWARLMLVSTTSSSGAAVIYTSAWQAERAAAPSRWMDPGRQHIRFTGFVDRWPLSWDNWHGRAQVTATDRQKLLSRATIRGALMEETLATGPIALYPLSEPQNASQAGNVAATSQPDMVIQSVGNGGALVFGKEGGPDDSATAFLTPIGSGAVGKFLAVPLLHTPLGGVAGISLAAWVRFTTDVTADQRILYVDDGSDTVHVRVNYQPSNNTLTVGVRHPSRDYVATAATPLGTGLHLVVVTLQFTAGTLAIRAYVDGDTVINTSGAATVTTWPSLKRLRAGGVPASALDPPQLMSGALAMVGAWRSVLTQTQASTLSNARDGFAGELSGARARRIAAWAGIPAISADTGSSMMDRHPNREQSPLAALKLIAVSEAGVLFVAGDDSVTLHGRGRRQLPGPPSIVLTADDCAGELGFTMDDQLLVNDVTVNRSGRTATRVIDQASIEESGGVYTGSIDTLLYTDTEALDRAAYTVATYGHPHPRAGQIVVDAHHLDMWPQLLGSEIGQRMRLSGLPPEASASTLELWCEGIQDEISDSTWRVTFDASPVRQMPLFILDDPAYGTLDNNYLGW